MKGILPLSRSDCRVPAEMPSIFLNSEDLSHRLLVLFIWPSSIILISIINFTLNTSRSSEVTNRGGEGFCPLYLRLISLPIGSFDAI